MKSISEIIKGFFSKKVKKSPDELFSEERSEKEMTAFEAYRKSKYGKVVSDRQLLEGFFADVRYMVESKTFNQRYGGMIEVDNDLLPYLEKIKEKLRGEGYLILELSDGVTVSKPGEETKEIKCKCGVTFLVFIWTEEALGINKEKKEFQSSDEPEEHGLDVIV